MMTALYSSVEIFFVSCLIITCCNSVQPIEWNAMYVAPRASIERPSGLWECIDLQPRQSRNVTFVDELGKHDVDTRWWW